MNALDLEPHVHLCRRCFREFQCTLYCRVDDVDGRLLGDSGQLCTGCEAARGEP
jgi:hypothetical protein